MASFKQGDKVKAIIEIKNGLFTPNVKEGAKGTVIGVKSNIVRVHFPSAGFGWPEVDCDVNNEYLKKI